MVPRYVWKDCGDQASESSVSRALRSGTAPNVKLGRLNEVLPQAAQTHVAREGCNVIYITYVARAGVALQATVENIRDFVWEIYY